MRRLQRSVLRAARIGALALLAAGVTAMPAAAPAAAVAAADPTTSSGPLVTTSVHNDTSPPLRDMVDTQAPTGHAGRQAPRRVQRPTGRDGARPSPVTTTAIPSTSTNFAGVGSGFSGPQGTFSVNAAPPDTNGAVGPNHYVQTVNTDYAVFNKSGSVLFGPVAINTLWSGFGGLCQADNDGDPVVRYDRIADRWIIVQFAVTNANGSSAPFLMCVAVSTSGDPTGSFNRYSFSYSSFPDYPKLSVWPDAYYLTVNQFNASGTSFLGANVAALSRSNMLAGSAATSIRFTAPTSVASLLASDVDSKTLPPSGSPNYVLSLGGSANTLAAFKFHVDFTTPSNSTFSGPTNLATQAFTDACNGGTCIPQSGTSTQLDSLGDRLMFRLGYRNFGDHESLVVSHSITAGSSTGIRWYELRISSGNPTIFQQGTYAPDSNFRWMPSLAMDGSGDIGLGFSESSSSINPEIHYTGRLAGDSLGTMSQGEGTIINGAGSQTGNLTRWGDYSAMTVDPSDDCTFWYTNEYIPANGSFNWRTRIGSFRFSSCGSTGGGGTVVTNGGFETGSLSGWSTSGADLPFVISSPVHTGSFAVQIGSKSPINGDSTLTQTVTIPSTASTLSFWYNPNCPDTIQFDQQQMEIRSTSGSVLATVLNVCQNTAAYTQKTADVSSFRGQTVVLWFNVHDDGFQGDPTFMDVDDVSIA